MSLCQCVYVNKKRVTKSLTNERAVHKFLMEEVVYMEMNPDNIGEFFVIGSDDRAYQLMITACRLVRLTSCNILLGEAE